MNNGARPAGLLASETKNHENVSNQEKAPRHGLNLLDWRPLRAMVHWPGFPYVFQAALLAAFMYLAALGWGRFAPDGVPGKLYAKTNLVNLLIWGLWWPAMVWAAVFFGRAWCAVCPLELVANGTERLGRAIGVKQRILGRWLRSGVLILAFYALIQMLVAGVHLHRVPAFTSLFLWGLLAAAGLAGFFLKDRAFCRGFCPVGLLLATYGRGSMLAVRRVGDEKCRGCTEKDCTRACNRNRLDARSCPSLLNPARLEASSDCLVCGQCIKACRPRENMGLFLRRPFHPADAREKLASWPLTLFVMLVSGFVAYELCSEWDAAKAVFLWVPGTVTESLALPGLEGWIKGAWMLFTFPALAWLVLGSLVLAARGAASMPEAWRRLALPLAVVIAAGHMAKGLAKVSSWGGYLPLALWEPTGQEHALSLAAGTVAKPAPLLPVGAVSVAGLILVLVLAMFALRESRVAAPASHRGRIVPIALVAAASVFLVIGWSLG